MKQYQEQRHSGESHRAYHNIWNSEGVSKGREIDFCSVLQADITTRNVSQSIAA